MTPLPLRRTALGALMALGLILMGCGGTSSGSSSSSSSNSTPTPSPSPLVLGIQLNILNSSLPVGTAQVQASLSTGSSQSAPVTSANVTSLYFPNDIYSPTLSASVQALSPNSAILASLNVPLSSATMTVSFGGSGPIVTGLQPSSGPSGGGTVVGVSGSGFTGATLVKFGAASGTKLSVISDTLLSVTAPSGLPGSNVDVTVAGPNGTSGVTSADRYSYTSGSAQAPTVKSVTPSQGLPQGGTTVAITGTGFSGATSVRFGNAFATNFTVISDVQLTVIAPAGGPGSTVDLTVITPAGTSAVNPNDQFTYSSSAPSVPTVSSVSPASGSSLGGTVVTVTGTGFTGASVVRFGNVAGTGLTVNSDTKLTVSAPAGASGTTVDVLVTTPAGTSAINSVDKYTYVNAVVPVVSNLAPTGGTRSGGTVVTITGSGFTGATQVLFGTASATFQVISDTQINATSPAVSQAGPQSVFVVGPGGTNQVSPVFNYQ